MLGLVFSSVVLIVGSKLKGLVDLVADDGVANLVMVDVVAVTVEDDTADAMDEGVVSSGV